MLATDQFVEFLPADKVLLKRLHFLHSGGMFWITCNTSHQVLIFTECTCYAADYGRNSCQNYSVSNSSRAQLYSLSNHGLLSSYRYIAAADKAWLLKPRYQLLLSDCSKLFINWKLFHQFAYMFIWCILMSDKFIYFIACHVKFGLSCGITKSLVHLVSYTDSGTIKSISCYSFNTMCYEYGLWASKCFASRPNQASDSA